MQIDWHLQFVLLLTFPVVGYSSKQNMDEKTGMKVEMCKKEDIGSQFGLHGDLGFGWHLVREQEREGRCPGTREKVEENLENSNKRKTELKNKNIYKL